MLQKIVWIWVSLFICLYADMHYVAQSSLLGTVADISVHHSENAKTYTTQIEIKAAGLAKMLSGNQRETHTSKGRVNQGKYYAREYVSIKRYKEFKYLKKYLFDYTHKKITKISKKWKNGKIIYTKKEILSYFSHNDLLTIYHNILYFKRKHKKSGNYTISLAGAEHDGGKVTFGLAGGKNMKSIDILTLIIRRKTFDKGKGKLLLEINKDGLVSRGELSSVKLLGKVTLKRVH